MRRPIPTVPDQVGCLSVLKQVASRDGTQWLCACICGREIVRNGCYLRRCYRDGLNATCGKCGARHAARREHVSSTHGYEPPRRKVCICKVCFNLSHRVPGIRCPGCKRRFAHEPRPDPVLRQAGNLARAMAVAA